MRLHTKNTDKKHTWLGGRLAGHISDTARRAQRRPNSYKGQREQGFVIILVVAVIVIMALMGIMYLQSARTQRLSVGHPQGNLQAAIAATNQAIMEALQDDLIDSDGYFFNPNSNIDPDTNEQTGYDEPYDYPWTNSDPATIHTVQSPVYQGNSYPVVGGQNDDTWLASTLPKTRNDPGYGSLGINEVAWPHITDLTGIYLQWNNSDEKFVDSGGNLIDNSNNGVLPGEDGVINLANQDESDTGLPVSAIPNSTNTNLYDADGDGIPDSRWAWVPMNTINGVIYVMAVRIVDLDSMLNINTALSSYGYTATQDNYDTSTDGTNAPHFRYPTAWDMGRWLSTLDGTSWQNDMENFLTYRLNSSHTDPYMSTSSRYNFWQDTARYYNPDAVTSGGALFGLDDEITLRYGDGMARKPADETPVTQTAAGLSGFLRSGGDEPNWQDNNINLGNYGAPDNSVDSYFKYEPRHQLTVSSGTAIFAPWPDNDPTGSRHLKLDPNKVLDSQTDADDIANRFYDVVNFVNTHTGSNAMQLPGYGTPTTPILADQYTAQFIANLADYVDAYTTLPTSAPSTAQQNANGVTEYTSGSQTAYGFEYMPFLAEVYVQRAYSSADQGTWATPPVGTPAPAAGNSIHKITWTPAAGSTTGYAIAIRNPFGHPVDLTSIQLVVGGTSWGAISGLTDASAKKDDGTNVGHQVYELKPHQALILYRDSGSGGKDKIGELTGATPAGLVDQAAGGAPTNIRQEITKSWPTGGGGEVQIELRCWVAPIGGTPGWATWAYSSIPSKELPATVNEPVEAPTTPLLPSETDYAQRFSIGNGEGLALITTQVMPNDESDDQVGNNNQGLRLHYVSGVSPLPRDTGSDNLGQADKTHSTVTVTVGPNFDQNNQVLLRNGDLYRAGELANLMVIGPNMNNDGLTFAQEWGVATHVAAFQLRFNPEGTTLPTPPAGNPYPANYVFDAGNFHIPYGAFVVSQFTALDPQYDGVDNDGDGDTDNTSNPLELLVPGMVNINTVSRQLLEKILPIADPVLRNAIIDKIMAVRDNPSRALAANPNPKGIANIGALLYNGSDGSGTQGLAEMLTSTVGSHNYTGDTQTAPPTGTDQVQLDFLNPVDGSGNMIDDGIADDHEEKTMLLQYLSQIMTVRSDRFAAYVEVRGYDSSDFGAGPVQVARYIAVFGRATKGGQAQLLHMQRTD